MPKKVKVSLKGIVQKIDQAVKGLTNAQKRAISASESRRLALKINNLKKARKAVQASCHPNGTYLGMTVIGLTK